MGVAVDQYLGYERIKEIYIELVWTMIDQFIAKI